MAILMVERMEKSLVVELAVQMVLMMVGRTAELTAGRMVSFLV